MKMETLIDVPQSLSPTVSVVDFTEGKFTELEAHDPSATILFSDVGKSIISTLEEMVNDLGWTMESPEKGQEGMLWSAKFTSKSIIILMGMVRYKGDGSNPHDHYMTMKVKAQDTVFDEFVLTYLSRMDHPPVMGADWPELEKSSGMTRSEILSQWEEVTLMPLLDTQVRLDTCINRELDCTTAINFLETAKSDYQSGSYGGYRDNLLQSRRLLDQLMSVEEEDLPVLTPIN